MKKIDEKFYNKSQIINDIAETHNLPVKVAEVVLNTLFDEISSSLLKGQRVEIRGFGSFEVRKYKGYKGRNPQNKELIRIKPKRLPFFRVGKFKRQVNIFEN